MVYIWFIKNNESGLERTEIETLNIAKGTYSHVDFPSYRKNVNWETKSPLKHPETEFESDMSDIDFPAVQLEAVAHTVATWNTLLCLTVS